MMLEFGSCPDMSSQNALETLACGMRVMWSAAIAEPGVAAAVGLSTAGTLIVSRSLAISIAVLLLAMLSADMFLTAVEPYQRQLRLAAAAMSLILLWAGCLRYRGRLTRQRNDIASLEAERESVKTKLEREIVWRRAAEPETGVSRVPADAGHSAV